MRYHYFTFIQSIPLYHSFSRTSENRDFYGEILNYLKAMMNTWKQWMTNNWICNTKENLRAYLGAQWGFDGCTTPKDPGWEPVLLEIKNFLGTS